MQVVCSHLGGVQFAWWSFGITKTYNTVVLNTEKIEKKTHKYLLY